LRHAAYYAAFPTFVEVGPPDFPERSKVRYALIGEFAQDPGFYRVLVFALG
jgi:hypothetical protein